VYLIRPPLTKEGGYWRPAFLPIGSQWEQLSAFDTAADCERGRERWQEASNRKIAAYKPPPTEASGSAPSLSEYAIMIHVAIMEAQCVASDDPRLTQNEPRPPVQPPPAPPVQLQPVTPAVQAAVTACRSVVRQETNSQFQATNSQLARLGMPIVESKFDAYVKPDGRVSFLGTQAENFSFQKCMNDRAYPLEH
jgi:hypothetical protein